ncbi:NYN domain-containing protein [soil metagenome]
MAGNGNNAGDGSNSGRATGGPGSQDDDQRRLAVLIDADNAQASVIEGLLAEVAKYGLASVKRIYGDFTSTRMQQWKQILLEHSIQPVQQFAYTTGKNATDSSMIIDAMDLMYTRRFDGFCLVTSDSDFTRLAQRLREEGLVVYGFGEQKTPSAFRQACDKFVYTEVLRPLSPPKSTPAAAPAKKATRKTAAKKTAATITAASARSAQHGNADAGPGPAGVAAQADEAPASDKSSASLPLGLLRKAIEHASDDSKWANLGSVGNYVNKVSPDFDPRLYGYKKLSDLFRQHPKYFEVEERSAGTTRALFVKAVE